MTIEYNPVGVACNLSCSYCYENPLRDAGNITTPKNWIKVKEVLEKKGQPFTVFGGEPLLTPIEHLKEVWEFGFKKFGHNNIQTNGALITNELIDLFEQYNVGVGISIDGPGHLNSYRRHNQDTDRATEASINAIDKLCALGRPPGLIVTIHQGNAGTLENLSELLRWFYYLEKKGIKHINLHMLEVEKGMENLSLTEEVNIEVFARLYHFSKSSGLYIQPFIDIYQLLTERYPNVSCIWNHCDPLTTAAVQGVSADGTESNCPRTNKDGINWIKGDKPGFERYLILHQTPQEFGGCKDCRFWVFCKGQCPGTAISGDWRNRTIHCRTWYRLFEDIERDIIASARLPNSKDQNFLTEKDKEFLETWIGDKHGDSAHGDTPHGDSHGDHTDATRKGIPGTFISRRPQ